MAKRILLAGILGGIAMFAWSFIAHMVVPLGMTGVSEIPNEGAVLSAMHASMGPRSGLYLFPGIGLGPSPSMKDVNAAMPQYVKSWRAIRKGCSFTIRRAARGWSRANC